MSTDGAPVAFIDKSKIGSSTVVVVVSTDVVAPLTVKLPDMIKLLPYVMLLASLDADIEFGANLVEASMALSVI